jgi:hypothetical protein
MSNSDNTLSGATFPRVILPISASSIRARTFLSIAALMRPIIADSIGSMAMTTDTPSLTDAPRPRRQKDDPRFAELLYLPALSTPSTSLSEVQKLAAVVNAARNWYKVCDPHSISDPEVRAAGIALGDAIDVLNNKES